MFILFGCQSLSKKVADEMLKSRMFDDPASNYYHNCTSFRNPMFHVSMLPRFHVLDPGLPRQRYWARYKDLGSCLYGAGGCCGIVGDLVLEQGRFLGESGKFSSKPCPGPWPFNASDIVHWKQGWRDHVDDYFPIAHLTSGAVALSPTKGIKGMHEPTPLHYWCLYFTNKSTIHELDIILRGLRI